MKKLLFLAIVIFCIPSQTEAHPGRTDASGCHHDNIHGGYHCHNGDTEEVNINIDHDYYTNQLNEEYNNGYKLGFDWGQKDGLEGDWVDYPLDESKSVPYHNGFREGYNDGFDQGNEEMMEAEESTSYFGNETTNEYSQISEIKPDTKDVVLENIIYIIILIVFVSPVVVYFIGLIIAIIVGIVQSIKEWYEGRKGKDKND